MKQLHRRYYFIVNIFANTGPEASRKLSRLLKQSKLDYKIFKTSRHYNIKDIVQKIQDSLHNRDIIISVGGDGSLGDLVQALKEAGLSNPVGVLPAGAGNDFIRAHQVSTKFDEAFDHLLQIQKPVVNDLILVENAKDKAYVVNSIGAGIDGRVIASISQDKSKQKLGPLTYLTPALKALFHQSPFDARVKILGKEIEVKKTPIILFMNHGSFGGGIQINPQADPTDGFMNIIFAKDLSFWDLLTLVVKIFTSKDQLNHPKVYQVRADQVEVQVRSNEYWQADGESLGSNQQTYKLSSLKQSYWI